MVNVKIYWDMNMRYFEIFPLNSEGSLTLGSVHNNLLRLLDTIFGCWLGRGMFFEVPILCTIDTNTFITRNGFWDCFGDIRKFKNSLVEF